MKQLNLKFVASFIFYSAFFLAYPVAIFAAGPAPVDLLTAGNFIILSETGITNTGSHTSAITGNIASSPITAAAMNGIFCSEITGTIYGVDATYIGSGDQTCFAGNPPLSNKTLVDNAVLDMGTVYADASGRTNPTATELGAGDISGMTITPGLYKWGTDVTIINDVTLSGGANDVWIFQIAGDLNVTAGGSVPAGIKVILAGGAQAKNIFWQVGGSTGATFGTYATFNGNVLSAKQIIMQTGVVFHGVALAQTQVTLDGSLVVENAVVSPINTPPIITIVGDNPFTLNINTNFIDPGATSTDAEDGNLTSQIIASSTVATTTVGTYTVVYTVTDSGGLSASSTRTVNVIADPIIVPVPVVIVSGGGFVGGSSFFANPAPVANIPTASTPLITSVPVVVVPIVAKPESVCTLLKSFLRFGSKKNDPVEMIKLQAFLNRNQGYDVDVNGVFDKKTLIGVNTFQTKYLSEVMGPWGENKSSGYVYITTKKKINQIACGAVFTINPEEKAVIDAYKASVLVQK